MLFVNAPYRMTAITLCAGGFKAGLFAISMVYRKIPSVRLFGSDLPASVMRYGVSGLAFHSSATCELGVCGSKGVVCGERLRVSLCVGKFFGTVFYESDYRRYGCAQDREIDSLAVKSF